MVYGDLVEVLEGTPMSLGRRLYRWVCVHLRPRHLCVICGHRYWRAARARRCEVGCTARVTRLAQALRRARWEGRL